MLGRRETTAREWCRRWRLANLITRGLLLATNRTTSPLAGAPGRVLDVDEFHLIAAALDRRLGARSAA